MSCYAPSHLIYVFFVSIILSSGSITVAQNQTINIGAIIDEDSRVGKEQKTAIEVAVRKLNLGSKTHQLTVHFKNSSGDPLQAASSAKKLIEEQNVRVIMGPDSWEETTLVAKIGERARTPVISSTATSQQPPTHLQWPFLVQMTNLNISDEIECITSIVQSYAWKRVIAVYEDNAYGGEYGDLPLLSESLQKIGSMIEHRLVVPHFTSPFDPKETIQDELIEILKKKQSRVFIVLKSSLQAATRVFEEADKLGLTGRDSVWILGDSFSSLLDSIDPSVFKHVQGALGVKAYYSETSPQFLDFKSNFKTTFRSSYPNEDKFEPGIHAIRAYDSVEAVSKALDRLGNFNDTASDFSEKLLDTILSSNFSGLTDMIAFQDDKLLSGPQVFQLVNIVGKSYKELGNWSRGSGFKDNLGSEGDLSLNQLAVNWPGDLMYRIPKGWAMPNNANKLKIGVPDSPSFDKFVKVERIKSTNETRYTGFCIDVFEKVVKILEARYGYTLPYEFVNHSGSYDGLVDQVYRKNFDAAVGDVTILADRLNKVEFTQPFMDSGLSMVVPVRKDPQKAWKFMRPFTVEMWLATFGIMFYTMFVVWFMEHQVNREFRGPWKDQLGTALWFTFSSLFFSHREKIQSNHSKVVVMIWLFVVFIITSSYQAGLTSMLTVRMLEPTVRDIEWVRKNNVSVGCDPDSFVGNYLRNVLGLENIKNVELQDQYTGNFESRNISAAFLELPYQKYFLRENCNYTAVGPSYKFGGLGFVFPKYSPITDDVSGAILWLLENGKIMELENKWLNTSRNCSDSNPRVESERLSLDNFWGIFLISGLTTTLSLVIFLYRLLHNRIEQRIISFSSSSGWNNGSRWRRALRLVQIVLHLNHNRVEPRESSNSAEEWDHQNPRRWEQVSPKEIPEHVEIGRPTQLELAVR